MLFATTAALALAAAALVRAGGHHQPKPHAGGAAKPKWTPAPFEPQAPAQRAAAVAYFEAEAVAALCGGACSYDMNAAEPGVLDDQSAAQSALGSVFVKSVVWSGDTDTASGSIQLLTSEVEQGVENALCPVGVNKAAVIEAAEPPDASGYLMGATHGAFKVAFTQLVSTAFFTLQHVPAGTTGAVEITLRHGATDVATVYVQLNPSAEAFEDADPPVFQRSAPIAVTAPAGVRFDNMLIGARGDATLLRFCLSSVGTPCAMRHHHDDDDDDDDSSSSSSSSSSDDDDDDHHHRPNGHHGGDMDADMDGNDGNAGGEANEGGDMNDGRRKRWHDDDDDDDDDDSSSSSHHRRYRPRLPDTLTVSQDAAASVCTLSPAFGEVCSVSFDEFDEAFVSAQMPPRLPKNGVSSVVFRGDVFDTFQSLAPDTDFEPKAKAFCSLAPDAGGVVMQRAPEPTFQNPVVGDGLYAPLTQASGAYVIEFANTVTVAVIELVDLADGAFVSFTVGSDGTDGPTVVVQKDSASDGDGSVVFTVSAPSGRFDELAVSVVGDPANAQAENEPGPMCVRAVGIPCKQLQHDSSSSSSSSSSSDDDE